MICTNPIYAECVKRRMMALDIVIKRMDETEKKFTMLNIQKKKSKDIGWEELDKVRMLGFGGVFMFGTRSLFYPATVIKTRLQCSHPSEKICTSQMFSHIMQTEGPRGLYRGFIVVAASLIPTQTIYYASYEWIKSQVSHACSRWETKEKNIQDVLKSNIKIASSLEQININVGMMNQTEPQISSSMILGEGSSIVMGSNVHVSMYADMLASLAAGASSSLLSQVIVVPTDVIAQNMMLSRQTKLEKYSSGFFNTVRKIYEGEGARGFYKGFSSSAVTYAVGGATWWFSYSMMKEFLTNPEDAEYSNSMLATQAISGSVASVFSTMLTHPMDVLKTQIQTGRYGASDLASMRKVATAYIRLEGFLSLFHKGLSARLMNSVPISVMMILSYEAAKRWSKKSEFDSKKL